MRGEFQPIAPLTHVVKRLVIINVAIWVLFIIIAQGFIFNDSRFTLWFGLTGYRVVQDFWVWQLFTYMFLHSSNVFHILFNMLLLWWIGGELEVYWGRRYFLFYYLTCGVGGAVLWSLGALFYYLATGQTGPLEIPVVGASGAIYGLMLAYGLLFGERVMYFMMLFPMKARYFVMIIAGVQILNQLSEGFKSQEAILAHLGGMVTGFLLLRVGPRIQEFWLRRQTRSHGRKLKLVVDNDRDGAKGPRYWN